jgi:radical SAM-linked protein
VAKYRLQFTKYGDMKYVSHLDLIRLFTRIFHRADLPLAYSEGFNPHPKMSVLLPLSVGFESACEYIDVEFKDGVGMLDCMKKLKGKLPLGMEIPQITQLNETSKKAKAIRYASYELTFTNPPSEKEIEDFWNLAEINVVKKTKRSEGLADIKPDIMDLYTADGKVYAVISAGSEANLKADLLVAAMEQYIDGFVADDYSVLRTGILDERGTPMM